MKLAEKLNLPPLELELMVLRAVRGSALIEGMGRSAARIGERIEERSRELDEGKRSASAMRH